MGNVARRNEALTNQFKPNGPVLSSSQNVKLGLRNRLLHILRLDRAELLDRLNDRLGALAEIVPSTLNGDGQKTGIAVSDVTGSGTDTNMVSNSLREEASSGVPLSGALTTKEVCQDLVLGLGLGATLGAGESNHNGISSIGVDAVLTTIVLGSGGGDVAVSGGDLREVLLGPLLEFSTGGTGGNDGNVALLVDLLGVAWNDLAVVAVVMDELVGESEEPVAETIVEGNVVGVLERNEGRGAFVGGDVTGKNRSNLLSKFVRWVPSDEI